MIHLKLPGSYSLHKSLPGPFLPSLTIILLSIVLWSNTSCTTPVKETTLEGFTVSDISGEQILTLNAKPGIRIHLNAPSPEHFDRSLPVCLVFYALPNGSSIEHTIGKVMTPGDDGKFDIQHIGAQTRYLRGSNPGYNLVIAYLENNLRSWPAWKAKHMDHSKIIHQITEQLRERFSSFDHYTVLNGHSGGGRFIFSYLDHSPEIPEHVRRIAFLDSDYGYEEIYGKKLTSWLERTSENKLLVLAYNDSIALYEGKTFVSPTGGTWYRSKMLYRNLSENFNFSKEENDSLIWYFTADKQIEIVLKKNPHREIFHTEQVEYNGFIHSMFSGTEKEEKAYRYFGERVYNHLIMQDTGLLPR